jgi:hypothetical protein
MYCSVYGILILLELMFLTFRTLLLSLDAQIEL